MTPSPDTIDLLMRRRSLPAQKLVEPGPTDEELEKILLCATRVPDHKGLCPWRIQIVGRTSQDKLHAKLPQLHERDDPTGLEKTLSKAPKQAPLLIIVSSYTPSRKAPRCEQILSGAAVCQNILIASSALGYRSQWLTEWFAYSEKVKEYLGIPTIEDIVGFIYIGTESEPPKERPRPKLSDVVTQLEL